MDLAIAIRIGSPSTNLDLVRTTIESIEKNIGKCSYRFIISLDPKVPSIVKKFIYFKKEKNPSRYQLLPEQTVFWADFINKAIKLSGDCRYFIKAHDDIKLITVDFFPKTEKIINSFKEPVGWISFDEIGYLNGHWCPATRPGWHKDFYEKDSWNKQQMFQFHNLPEHWANPFLKFLPFKFRDNFVLDMPLSPVKCHAPWNMFVMIKMSVLKKIGPCENWQTYNALLVDEDWGLRALEKGFWNIWIPNIKYLHVQSKGGQGNRSQTMIQKDAKRVHALFKKKWGFDTPPKKFELSKIKKRFANTNVPWSIGRNSYNWDYIKTELFSTKLHLGCGNIKLNGFINIDIVKTSAVDKIMDVRHLDFPDSSIETIYAAHILEHFPHGEVPLVLKEWRRVLKKGGKIIIVVPSFDKHLEIYTKNNCLLNDNLIADITGGSLYPEYSYRIEDYHKTIFNSVEIEKLAKISGFTKVREIDLENEKFPIEGINRNSLHYSSMVFEFEK